MNRISTALRKIHPEEPWRQIAPGAVTEEDVDDILDTLQSGGETPAVVADATKARAPLEIDGVPMQFTGIDFDDPLTARLVLSGQVDFVTVEQYRRLASVLHQGQVERKIKIVMVTSAMPGEGKTLTATNLALTLSGTFKREVLLVDADLRRAMLAQVFGASHAAGITEALRGDHEQKFRVLKPSPRLSVLLSGEPDSDPISSLSSDRMRLLLADAADHFDWVIVDTPPAALMPDAGLLASFVDGVVLVVRAGTAPQAIIQQAIASVGRDRILGVVLNSGEGGELRHYGYYGTPYSTPAPLTQPAVD